MHLSSNTVQEIQKMLLERAQILKLQPQQLLGNADSTLQQRYPTATLTVYEPAPQLPFRDEQFDLILLRQAGLLLQPLEQSLAELKRVLKVQGILLLATWGIEMHTFGDALLKAGFADPVTDIEYLEPDITFAYAWRKPNSFYQAENGDVSIPISTLFKTKA